MHYVHEIGFRAQYTFVKGRFKTAHAFAGIVKTRIFLIAGLYWQERPSEGIGDAHFSIQAGGHILRLVADCDKSLHDKGGVIDIPMMGLSAPQYVDCLWIIEKSKYSLPIYDSLYLKIHEFALGLPGITGKTS